MRFDSSQISWRRITTRDTDVGGYDVPAGTAVFLNFASANRQPGIWHDPDMFDIHRPDANRHISFGKGVHYCLGARLAKVETQLVIEALTQRIPSLRLAGDRPLDYFPNITFRGPTELPIAWDRSSGSGSDPWHDRQTELSIAWDRSSAATTDTSALRPRAG